MASAENCNNDESPTGSECFVPLLQLQIQQQPQQDSSYRATAATEVEDDNNKPTPTIASLRNPFEPMVQFAAEQPWRHHSDSQLDQIQRATSSLLGATRRTSFFLPNDQSPEATGATGSSSAATHSNDAASSLASIGPDHRCQLCPPPDKQHLLADTSADEQDSAAPTAAVRRLPCSCPRDAARRCRMVHAACLEAKFAEASQSGLLTIRCAGCGDAIAVTRRRRRRECTAGVWRSFARHLLATLPLAVGLIGFGLWSMLHPAGGRVNIVNAALVVAGSAIALGFAGYELWQMFCHWDFVLARLDGGSRGAFGSAVRRVQLMAWRM